MRRIKLTFSYDGTDFFGYQIQPTERTVQQELEHALEKTFGQNIQTTASGRTDRGVHALGQVAHFDVQTTIPIDKLTMVINNNLPKDIIIKSAEMVNEDFHARYGAIQKTYCYIIDNSITPDILNRRYAYHITAKLDIDAMQQAAKFLIGEHDFTSFCSQKTNIIDKVRTIYAIDIKTINNTNNNNSSIDGNIIEIYITGSGFLYNMVRIIVGTLLDVGKNKLQPIDVQNILVAKDRTQATITAPPHGLMLYNVTYK